MAKFQAGQLKPENSGRQKGRPNNRTLFLKTITDDLGLDVPHQLGELLPQLEPAKQADVLLELMSYLYPKRRAIEHSGINGEPIQIETKRVDIKKLLCDPEAISAMELLDGKLSDNAHDKG